MKSFVPTTVLLSLFVFVGSAVAMTVGEVVTNINVVTTLSGNLNELVGSLSTSTDAQTVTAIGQQTVQQFQTIISDLSGDVNAMDGTVFADPDAKTVVGALQTFVQVHQALLATVIGKQSIFAQFGVTAPIASVLRSLEASIDSFAYALIDMIPTQAPVVQNDKAGLDTSVTDAISKYEQICIPSPLYPTIMPFCLDN